MVEVGPDGGYVEALLAAIGHRRLVLIGEASHGTHEFYAERARITRALIEHLGFDAVAVEADWPDAHRVHRYVTGAAGDDDPLGDFRRFPSWMWRNVVVRDFVEWLRARNAAVAGPPTGFYGIDLYSLRASIDAVLPYLDEHDPGAAERARRRYACFDHLDEPGQRYGYETERGGADPCEEAVIEQLRELQRSADGDAWFAAEQNARLIRNAERYYRAMYRGRDESWNLRDRHMAETIAALDERITAERRRRARIVVWAHNSHLGDARATEMGERGELNVGQLVRERWPGQSFLVGFTPDRGTVTAAHDWGGDPERMRVRPGLRGSYEHPFADEWPSAFAIAPAEEAVPDRCLQ